MCSGESADYNPRGESCPVTSKNYLLVQYFLGKITNLKGKVLLQEEIKGGPEFISEPNLIEHMEIYSLSLLLPLSQIKCIV